MKRFLLGLAASIAMAAPAVADWKHQGSTIGPRGFTVQSQGQGSCAGGRCEWTRVSTGPKGQSASTSGSATRTAPGKWSSTATTTGPHGGTVKRQGTFQVIR
jgi:hypothetical protein